MNAEVSEEWKRYGRAVIQAMREVVEETDEPAHGPLLETADYWLSLGLAIGLRLPREAVRLLELIEAHGEERAKLEEDAEAFCAEALK